jgi:ABC-type Fe3+/spermidine/putrescine transport system ATPase subunit
MLLKIENIQLSFAGETVLQNLSLEVVAHQTLAILGRSGCGKTTLLKVIAGLRTPNSGNLFLNGSSILSVPPQERGIVYLYQEALLFPHLNVFENVAFGLRIRREKEATVRARTLEMLENLEMADYQHKMPPQLSGGQKQRVSFGRALIINPPLLLLDEPFGSLDAETRTLMQDLFKRVARQYRITSLFVTHDLKEAIRMGDQLARMKAGKLVTYDDLPAFMADPQSGFAEEMRFWESLQAFKK